MKNIFTIAITLLFSFTTSSMAQRRMEAAPEKKENSLADQLSLVDKEDFSNALKSILAAAPNSFKDVKGEDITDGRDKGSSKGKVNVKSCPDCALLRGGGNLYVLPLLRNVDKSVLSPSAIACQKIIMKVMGKNTSMTESSEFTVQYTFRNSDRKERIDLAIHPYGHLTVFIYASDF